MAHIVYQTVSFSGTKKVYSYAGRPKLDTALSYFVSVSAKKKKQQNYDAYMMSGGCVFNKLLKCGK